MKEGMKNIILKDVPEELHYQFMILTRQLRQTMKSRIMFLMTRDVTDHQNKVEQKDGFLK